MTIMHKTLSLALLLMGLPTWAMAENDMQQLETTIQAVEKPDDARAVPALSADWHGATALAMQQKTLTAQDEAGWQAIWQQVGQTAPSNLPDDKHAIAIFAGQKRTGGYGVQIVEQIDTKDQTTIRYRLTKPGFRTMVTQVITSPYAIVLVPRHDHPVLLQEVQ
jgi:hypothetical protein